MLTDVLALAKIEDCKPFLKTAKQSRLLRVGGQREVQKNIPLTILNH